MSSSDATLLPMTRFPQDSPIPPGSNGEHRPGYAMEEVYKVAPQKQEAAHTLINFSCAVVRPCPGAQFHVPDSVALAPRTVGAFALTERCARARETLAECAFGPDNTRP